MTDYRNTVGKSSKMQTSSVASVEDETNDEEKRKLVINTERLLNEIIIAAVGGVASAVAVTVVLKDRDK